MHGALVAAKVPRAAMSDDFLLSIFFPADVNAAVAAARFLAGLSLLDEENVIFVLYFR
jgi:hypothetical protein